MSFMDAVKSGFSNYITIQGRAPRSAYWWWALFIFLPSIVLGLADGGIFGTVLGAGGLLGTLLPSITVGIRRLHDTGRTGWWLLIVLVPVVGVIVLLVFFVMRGNEGANDYGPDPLAG